MFTSNSFVSDDGEIWGSGVGGTSFSLRGDLGRIVELEAVTAASRIISSSSRFTISWLEVVWFRRVWGVEHGVRWFDESFVAILLRILAITLKVGAVTVHRCSGRTCNPNTVTADMRVTENGYGGGSLDRGRLANDPLLLAPNDLSNENGWVATVVKNGLMIVTASGAAAKRLLRWNERCLHAR